MKKVFRFLAGALAPLFLLCGCQLSTDTIGSAAPVQQVTGSAAVSQSSSVASAAGKNTVWFFDVGQGDSELLQLADGKNILIDAGTSECGSYLVKELKSLGIQKLDMVVATHPHADHIGGMQKIVENFSIGQYYMPRIADKDVPTSATYSHLLRAIQKKGIKATPVKAGLTMLSDSTCKAVFLAPKSASYKALNNYSAVLMVTIGQKKFLFTGDAEKESEQQMVQGGAALHADVLKCGHHGSKTSTSASFLKAVSPTYAVISCGRKNDYGFPPQQTLSHLKASGVQIYRTDEQKTICAHTDGKSISFTTGLASVTGT